MSDEDVARVVRAITDDFCESFSEPDGIFGRLIAWGHLPEGVDPGDPRVAEIIRKCCAANEAKQIDP